MNQPFSGEDYFGNRLRLKFWCNQFFLNRQQMVCILRICDFFRFCIIMMRILGMTTHDQALGMGFQPG